MSSDILQVANLVTLVMHIGCQPLGHQLLVL